MKKKKRKKREKTKKRANKYRVSQYFQTPTNPGDALSNVLLYSKPNKNYKYK
jgi:hypothetical protein